MMEELVALQQANKTIEQRNVDLEDEVAQYKLKINETNNYISIIKEQQIEIINQKQLKSDLEKKITVLKK